mgnify:CR=1 FL=1
MGLLDILFGGGKKKVSKETAETRGDHMPDLNIPVDEKFTIHLQNIILENNWQSEPFYVINKRLAEKFSKESISFTDKAKQSEVFLTTCEHLIAQNGSILVCSNQLHEKKVNELPSNLVVFATTSQLVESIGEGLKTIKKKYGQKIPGNITTLKHFKATAENSDDFLTYGSSTKNLYLLLLEDL